MKLLLCSLGVVFWELITLRRPWDDNEPEDSSSLEDAWVPDYEHGNEPVVQQQSITKYGIIQVHGQPSHKDPVDSFPDLYHISSFL